LKIQNQQQMQLSLQLKIQNQQQQLRNLQRNPTESFDLVKLIVRPVEISPRVSFLFIVCYCGQV
jgi:hypothetical protein